MIKRVGVVFLTGALLAGCAGQNYVQTFEPVVDMQNVNQGKYQSDLGDCRSYAVREDPANKAARQALAGAIIGAALGAAVGASYGNAGYGAGIGTAYGAGAGVVHGAVTGMRAQQVIVARCMAGRGYKVLYGGDLAG